MILSLREEPGMHQTQPQATSSVPTSQQGKLQSTTTLGWSRADTRELSLNAAWLCPGQLGLQKAGVRRWEHSTAERKRLGW